MLIFVFLAITSVIADGTLFCSGHNHQRDCLHGSSTGVPTEHRFGVGWGNWISQPFTAGQFLQVYYYGPPSGIATQIYTVEAPSNTKFACGQKADETTGGLCIIWCDKFDYNDRATSCFFPGLSTQPTATEMCGCGYFDGVEVWPSNTAATYFSVAGLELLCRNMDF